MYINVKTLGARFAINVLPEEAATITIEDFARSIAKFLTADLDEVILKRGGETIFNQRNEAIDTTRTLFSSLKLQEIPYVTLMPTTCVNTMIRLVAAKEDSPITIEAGGPFDDLLARSTPGMRC